MLEKIMSFSPARSPTTGFSATSSDAFTKVLCNLTINSNYTFVTARNGIVLNIPLNVDNRTFLRVSSVLLPEVSLNF